MFFDAQGLNVSASDIIQIVIILIILGLLAFVVIRSMRGEKQTQQPEELSVETPFNEFAYHAIKALEEKNMGVIK